MIKIPAVHAGVISGIKIANRGLSPCSLLSRSCSQCEKRTKRSSKSFWRFMTSTLIAMVEPWVTASFSRIRPSPEPIGWGSYRYAPTRAGRWWSLQWAYKQLAIKYRGESGLTTDAPLLLRLSNKPLKAMLGDQIGIGKAPYIQGNRVAEERYQVNDACIFRDCKSNLKLI
jgi:hypothetical protein